MNQDNIIIVDNIKRKGAIMCNHNINNKEFKFCPYCGRSLKESKNKIEEGNKRIEDHSPVFHSHNCGKIQTDMVSIEDFNPIEAAYYIKEKITSGKKYFNHDYYQVLSSIINEFGYDKTFIAEETEFNIGDITVLYNAGLIGLAGKGDGTINLYDNIYKEIKVNKYIVNPRAMQVLYIAATELQTECKSKN